MVNLNIHEPPTNEYKPLAQPLLSGTRDDRLRTFGTCRHGVDLTGPCLHCDDDLIAELELNAANHNDSADDAEERAEWSARLQQNDQEPW